MATYKKKPKTKPSVAKKDILIYADFDCTTGFGNVAKELVDRCAKEADSKTTFYVFALNNFNKETYNYLPNVIVIPANIAPFATQDDCFQKAAFVKLVENTHFNVIYLLNDIEVVGKLSGDLKLINVDKKKRKELQHKTIFYFPIDSVPRKENLAFLQMFDEIVTFTEYGKNLIEKLAPINVYVKIQVLSHGVDNNNFFKIYDETIIEKKNKMFGEDKYVFGTINRNSARKDIASTLLAFSEFLEAFKNVSYLKDKYVLYCHCNPEDVAGINLKYLALTLGLEEGKNVFFPKNFSENKGVSTKELNEIYNLFDCFLNTTTAEGWGLTLTEAMAAEILCIAPMHTSFVEITQYGNNCIAITDLIPSVFIGDGCKVRYKTDPSILANLMHTATTLEKSEIDFYTRNAKEHVVKYSWDKTASEFWKLINKYL